MSNAPWCAIYTSGKSSLVSTSTDKIQCVVTKYPAAEIKWFSTAENGWRWIRDMEAARLTGTGKQKTASPKKSRLGSSSPYKTTPSSSAFPKSFKRESVLQALRSARSSLSDIHVPGAFPVERAESPTLNDPGSESDYVFDDQDPALDDPLFEALDESYSVSIPNTFSSRTFNAGLETREEADVDIRSTNSYEGDDPLEDLPLGEESICYDDLPTPPSSQAYSQISLGSPSLSAPPSQTNSPIKHSPVRPRPNTSLSGVSAILSMSLSQSFPVDTTVSQGTVPSPMEKMKMSEEQNSVLQRVLAGESLFFTGSAGTGKSVLLREIITALRGRFGGGVAVTASTGVAALNIEGQTLHSFAGVGLGRQTLPVLIKKIQGNIPVRDRWRGTRVLIVDEISMVDGDWFDTLESIARAIRDKQQPFGGIQLVLCGDFFQLPPVDEQQGDAFLPAKRAKFAFEAWAWYSCVPRMVTLTQVFRQKEPMLIKMLNEMRVGRILEDTNELFYGLSRQLIYDDGIEPTELFPRRWSVDVSNQRHLDLIEGELLMCTCQDAYFYDAADQKITPARGRAILDKLVAASLEFKIGAQVMCTKNLGGAARLVNGSIGKVVDFMTPIVARTSQKYTNNESPRPRPYTSVFSDLEPDRTLRPGDTHYKPPDHVYEKTKWPIVEYIGGHRVLMGPVKFTSERVTDGEIQASRLQVPLILAWALTIHKSQGQTLERVKVSLGGTFEYGQAYVALSRCTSLEGLEVHQFSPRVVMADPKVLEWSGLLDPSDSTSQPASRYKPPKREPAPPPFGRFENQPERFRAANSRKVMKAPQSEDDEESLAIQMYHSP